LAKREGYEEKIKNGENLSSQKMGFLPSVIVFWDFEREI